MIQSTFWNQFLASRKTKFSSKRKPKISNTCVDQREFNRLRSFTKVNHMREHVSRGTMSAAWRSAVSKQKLLLFEHFTTKSLWTPRWRYFGWSGLDPPKQDQKAKTRWYCSKWVQDSGTTEHDRAAHTRTYCSMPVTSVLIKAVLQERLCMVSTWISCIAMEPLGVNMAEVTTFPSKLLIISQLFCFQSSCSSRKQSYG